MSQNQPTPDPKIPFNIPLAKILQMPEELRERAFKRIEEVDPEVAKQIAHYLTANKGVVLEAKGYEQWLSTIGPHSFTGDFSDFHKDIWNWYWPVTAQQRAGLPLDLEDLTYFALWGRGLGKSTHSEWLAICEGCLIGKGFVLYVSGTAEQAEAHVEAIRERIESEGQLGNLYPAMRKPEISEHKGGKGKQAGYGWRQDYLMTSNGWAVRPVGLDKAIRGWKRGDTRVSLIILDDIDDDDDSPEVILKKERRIAKKILPMGTARTKVVFAQNLIHSNSVLNRMHTRQTDILALRKGDVPVKAFDEIEIEHQVTPRGPRSVIISGKPTWPYIDMAECQSFLDRSGYDAFMAEYQHDFTGEHQDRVLPEYDDRVLRTHLITWEQFFAKYGAERIPREWPCDVGLDLGYTTGHLSAWTFLTKVPEGYPLAGSIFRYRGCTFENVSLTAQEALVKARMWPNEEIQREFMSHEKLGEQLTLNREHGWHFRPCDSGKTAGLAQWRHYLIPDRKQPHPFHRDEKGEDGLWKIGCPAWFDITVSSQFHVPNMVDDLGLKTHRDQTYKWKMRPVEETKSGMTVEQPIKAREDTCFVAGTMITTEKGDIPIENISENDVVLTRQGWYPVERAGMTSENAEIWTIKLSNGSQLSGTKAHPIWVAGYGWKPLSEIKVGEKLLSSKECDSTVTPTQSIGRTERILSHMWEQLRRDSRHYTSNSGRRLMGHSPKVLLFTTATTIPSTMRVPTWNRLLVRNIAAITDRIIPPNEKRDTERLYLRYENSLKHGIGVKKGESGIGNTLKIVFSQLRRSCDRVITVATNGWHDHFGIGFVRTLASKNSTIIVTSVKKEDGLRSVYNLSVKDVPEYFANGMLVHNCDSSRMLTVNFGPLLKTMTPDQKLRAMIPTEYQPAQMLQRGAHPNQIAVTNALAMVLAKQAAGGGNKPLILDEYGNARS